MSLTYEQLKKIKRDHREAFKALAKAERDLGHARERQEQATIPESIEGEVLTRKTLLERIQKEYDEVTQKLRSAWAQ